jgi:hypothetical protein
LPRVVWCKFSDVSEVLAGCAIALVMEAASNTKLLVNFYQTTQRNNQKTAIFNSWVVLVVGLQG